MPWSNIPIELRFRILQFIFVGEVVSYSRPRFATMSEKTSLSLTLQLVSKLFARREEITAAMLSKAALSLRTGLDLDLISTNPTYHGGFLTRLSTMEIARDVTDLGELRLSKLQRLLPCLSLIRILISGSPFGILNLRVTTRELSLLSPLTLCQICPQFIVSNDQTTAVLIELLKKANSDDGPLYSISCGIDDDTSHAAKQTLELSCTDEDISKASWKNVFEHALVHEHTRHLDTGYCAQWLAALLTDIQSTKDESRSIEVTLSWHLSIGVDTMVGNRRSRALYLLQNVSFSTDVMQIRVLLGDTEVILPQDFSPDLAVFAHSQDSNH